MRLLTRRGILTSATGNADFYRSLRFLNQVNSSTISRWKIFERIKSSVRQPGTKWPPTGKRSKRYEPFLRGYAVPLSVLGVAPEELGVTNGWVVNRYAIIETMTRIRNEILGLHPVYPLEQGKNYYSLDSGDFRHLYRMIHDGTWIDLISPAAAQSNGERHAKMLIDLWLIPFGLICSVSSSLGDYIRGFTEDANEA